MTDELDPRMAKALVRYEVISPFLALKPMRGQKKQLLERLAAQPRTWPDGTTFTVSPETIRVWLRRYRREGLDSLMDKKRPRRGTRVLRPEVVEMACKLKREVPARTLDRLIRMLEHLGVAEPGEVRRSTLHRELKRRGLSRRPRSRKPDVGDLDRFEASRPNELWQSDMLTGPWLPDPARPGKMRRAYLYAFLDDHSRLLLYGRWSFKGDLPALELVFRRAIQRFGVPTRLYYDNGMVYRSGHMKQIAAALGVHRIVHTKPYRPEGHGKIEALNRLIRGSFLSELDVSGRQTLDEVNEAFLAWADIEYNRCVHTEIGEPPRTRWRAGLSRVRFADEPTVRRAFLWTEKRTPDKAGVFSLFGVRYQTGPEAARRRIQVRYDPEALESVEVWLDDRFLERVRPLEVRPHRRPTPAADTDAPPKISTPSGPPACDWLGHLVETRRQEQIAIPSLEAPVARHVGVLSVLREHLDAAVCDERAARDYLDRYGPFDPEHVAVLLPSLVADMGSARHVTVYLEAVRRHLQGRRS